MKDFKAVTNTKVNHHELAVCIFTHFILSFINNFLIVDYFERLNMTTLYICVGVLFFILNSDWGGEWKLSDESGYLTLNNDWRVQISGECK